MSRYDQLQSGPHYPPRGLYDRINVDEAIQPTTKPVQTLTGFEPFAARGVIVTDELIHQLRDEACV